MFFVGTIILIIVLIVDYVFPSISFISIYLLFIFS